MEECSLVRNPMVIGCNLRKMDESLAVDETLYRSIIGNILYLTTSRPDIMQVVAIVGLFQAAPKQSHLLTPRGFLDIS